MKQFDWEGVMPAITTQFDKNGVLDLKAFRNNLSNQIKAGVHGIILGGTLGEASTLKDLEKKELLATTLDEVNGKIPVIMNIAEQATAKAVELAKELEAEGADGLMLLPPMRYKANDQETVAYFSSVASSTSLPIMIYNNPVEYKIEVTLDMFEKLKEYKNISAVKESTRDVTNITRMINRFGDRFKILCGVDTIAIPKPLFIFGRLSALENILLPGLETLSITVITGEPELYFKSIVKTFLLSLFATLKLFI